MAPEFGESFGSVIVLIYGAFVVAYVGAALAATIALAWLAARLDPAVGALVPVAAVLVAWRGSAPIFAVPLTVAGVPVAAYWFVRAFGRARQRAEP